MALVYVQGGAVRPHASDDEEYLRFLNVVSDYKGDHNAKRRDTLSRRLAFAKFPNLSNCTDVQSDAPSAKAAIDWNAIKIPSHLEVCLFHVASDLKTPEALSEWLSSIGAEYLSFDVGSVSPASKLIGHQQVGISMSSIEEFGFRPSLYWRTLGIGVSATVQFSPDNNITTVRVSTSIL